MRVKYVLIFLFISLFSYSETMLSDLVEKKVRKTINKYLKLELFDYHPVLAVPELGLKEDHVFKIILEIAPWVRPSIPSLCELCTITLTPRRQKAKVRGAVSPLTRESQVGAPLTSIY